MNEPARDLRHNFCFECGRVLEKNVAGLLACSCGWINYNGPKSVVAALVPVGADFDYIFAHPEKSSVVLTQRAIAPFVGGWCWPGGYVNEGEDPLDAVVREVWEETGLEVEPVFLFDHRNPMPGTLNQIVSMYLCRLKEGIMRKSTETLDVRAFTQYSRPELCFSTHEMFTNAWYGGKIREGVRRVEYESHGMFASVMPAALTRIEKAPTRM